MPLEDPNDLDRVDRDIRINELKNEASDLAGSEMTAWESDDCPPDLAEQFWQQVVDYEKSSFTTHFEQLTKAGLDLPAAEDLDDQALKAKLWELIEQLGRMRVFLSRTDHLNDRELYRHLWEESLREEVPDLPFDENSSWEIDILGGCSMEDLFLDRKYYADEEARQRWAREWPDDPMPDHEDPPYDRDRHLPKSGW